MVNYDRFKFSLEDKDSPIFINGIRNLDVIFTPTQHDSDSIHSMGSIFDEGVLMVIRIGSYFMDKLTSIYEHERYKVWYFHLGFIGEHDYIFRLNSFDEFKDDNWLDKWLDKIIERSDIIIREADAKFRKKYKEKMQIESLPKNYRYK